LNGSLRFAVASALVAAAMTTASLAAQHQHQPAAAAADGKLGAGVTVTDVTPIADLYASPEKFVGKTIRLDGVVSAVCESMGCWMALASEANPEHVVRFKVEHGTGIVFPIAAKGKKASAQGVFEKVAAGDAEGTEAAAEQQAATGKVSAFGTTYQIKATGAVIK
jgi:hypothetical protein